MIALLAKHIKEVFFNNFCDIVVMRDFFLCLPFVLILSHFYNVLIDRHL